ncbi:MAG: hypothetical protein ACP5FT_01685 [Acidilobus sp.]
MEGCPSLVATSAPSKDRWGLEEFMDTVMTSDPEATVKVTRYRGVFVAFSARDPRVVVQKFLAFTHAFLARVYPVMACSDASGLERLLGEAVKALRGPVKLEVKLRDPLSRVMSEDDVRSAARKAGIVISKSAQLVLVLESLEDKLLLSYGRPAACGPSCKVIIPP